MQKLTATMTWAAAVGLGTCLSVAALELHIVPLQIFNEMAMRPAAVRGDLAVRVPRAFFWGLDSAAVAAGAGADLAGLVAGLISAGFLFGLFKLIVPAVRQSRIKEPANLATRGGDLFYWFGCMLGAYFLCSAVLVTPRLFDAPGAVALHIIGLIVWTAALCWSIGYCVRYLLGCSSLSF